MPIATSPGYRPLGEHGLVDAVARAAHAPELMVRIGHYDPQLFLIHMGRLQPHIIMRRGMIDGIVCPHIAEYLAHRGSHLHRSLHDPRAQPLDRPQLDDAARSIREDGPLRRAVSILKAKFPTESQALLHGDLQTGWC